MGLALAIKVGVTLAAPMFKVALASLVRVLAPARVVVTVIVPALVKVLSTVNVVAVNVPLFC